MPQGTFTASTETALRPFSVLGAAVAGCSGANAASALATHAGAGSA